MRIVTVVSCATLMLFSGCIQTIAVSTVGGIVDEGFEAFTSESDLEFAEQALPGNLKLIEVMLRSQPENVRLLRLASQGYASYALAFLEGKDDVRAREFYLRGRDFALRIVRQDAPLAKALDGGPETLAAELSQRGKDDVPGLFWTAFGWGSYIQLALTEPAAIADLPRVQTMMEFVARVDSAYYYAGAHLFLGTLYGTRPKMLGGDLDKSKAHFETALRLTGGKFLLTDVYYARSYAVQAQDEAFFSELLARVRDTPLEVLPEFRLANAIAKRKAEALLAKKGELF